LVGEIGRGRDEEERSLEMTEVSREGGRRRWRQESGLQIIWKKDRESLTRLSLSELELATNKTLGYDMPWVSLKMICTARFWTGDNNDDCLSSVY